MKFATAALLGLASAATATAQNVVQLDINRRQPGQGPPTLNRRLDSRATYTETLVNNITGGGYYAVVEVGTPGQQMSLVLDTGSADAWVVYYAADLCTSAKLQAYYGDSCGETYDPKKSSTYKLVQAGGFDISYLDGGGAAGDYISDTFSIGGMTIKNLEMGLADQTARGTGILGVGFDADESAEVIYPNIMDQMVNQGLISTKAFSLYLNDYRSDSGAVVFGGMDTEKFIGELQVLPMLKGSGQNYTAFAVTMSGLAVEYANGTATNVSTAANALPAILDSGTTLSYLPDSLASELVSQLDAYTDYRETGLTFINCDYLNSDAGFTLALTLGSGSSTTTILVPTVEMVLDVLDGYSSQLPHGIPFSNVCLFGMQSSGSIATQGGSSSTQTQTYALLGDTFLRSAYVVYDLLSAEIGIAQANLNSTNSNIIELSQGAGIPSTTGVTAQQTSTGTASAEGTGAGTGSSQGTGQATVTTTTTPSASKNAAAVLGPGLRSSSGEGLIVVALAGLFTMAGAALFVL